MNNDRRRRGWCRALLHLAMALSVLLGRGVQAELVPPTGMVDSRIRVTPYDPEQVYRLHGFVGYQIDVEFEAGETFVGLGAGDIEGLSYVGQGNHLFLKPKAAKVATNLTVLTSRRHYQFDYSAMSQRPAPGDPQVIFALRFTYPPTPSKAAREAAARRIDADLRLAADRRPKNVDYWYCGRADLKPELASDDGVQTRLRFAAGAELPAIFVRAEDGGESLLNFSMENGDVIVHRIARQFILRRGSLTGCIVNKGFAGSGARLESGTVTPEVERRIRGGAP